MPRVEVGICCDIAMYIHLTIESTSAYVHSYIHISVGLFMLALRTI